MCLTRCVTLVILRLSFRLAATCSICKSLFSSTPDGKHRVVLGCGIISTYHHEKVGASHPLPYLPLRYPWQICAAGMLTKVVPDLTGCMPCNRVAVLQKLMAEERSFIWADFKRARSIFRAAYPLNFKMLAPQLLHLDLDFVFRVNCIRYCLFLPKFRASSTRLSVGLQIPESTLSHKLRNGTEEERNGNQKERSKPARR